MNKKQLAIMIMGGVLTSTAFSASFLQKMTQSASKKMPKMHAISVASDNSSPLSGEWVGSCDEGVTFKLTLNDSSLSMGVNNEFNLFLPINDFKTESHMSRGYASNSPIWLYWTQQKTVLSGDSIDVSTDFESRPLSTSLNHFQFSLNSAEQLILDTDYKEFSGAEEIENSHEQCIFNRVS